jgi:arylsulfatase A
MRLDRRNFIKMSGAASFLAASGSLFAGNKSKGRKPNVIYILADDLGYGDLGCYGQKLIKTPVVDGMAKEGMKFTQHYSGSALCAPSRCSLMTGKHTGHTFIRNNKPMPREGNLPIPKDEITIGEVMQKAGYVTACIGKWGLGYPGSEGDPNNQGFDHWFGYNCQRQAHNYYPLHLWRNTDKVMLKGNEKGGKKVYSHDLLTKEALGFINDNKDKPFFLYLPYTIPHTKFQIPDLGEYADTDWAQNHKIQAAMISRMDGDVGKILDLLKELGLDDDTLVIFTSDNGAHGQGGTVAKFKASGELRAKKGTLFEGGLRVPMVARWPKKIKAGAVSDHVSAFWDILPTWCEITGQKVPADSDGISMLPELLGDSKDQKTHKYLYWELGPTQALRKDNFKLIRKWSKKKESAQTALYDLSKDISESKNLAKDNPAVVSQLLEVMDSARFNSTEFKTPYDKG